MEECDGTDERECRASWWLPLGGSSHDSRHALGVMVPAAESRSAASATGRTSSTIARLNLSASSANGSCPDSSNQTSVFDGAISASKYATLVSGGTQWSRRPRKKN